MNKKEIQNYVNAITIDPKALNDYKKARERQEAEARFWFMLTEMKFKQYKNNVQSQDIEAD